MSPGEFSLLQSAFTSLGLVSHGTQKAGITARCLKEALFAATRALSPEGIKHCSP